MQKILSLSNNQLEVWVVIFVILLALSFKSVVSLFFLLASCVLLHTQTYGYKLRLTLDFYYMIFFNALLVGVVIWKELKRGDLIAITQDWKAFRYEIHFYECLGFVL